MTAPLRLIALACAALITLTACSEQEQDPAQAGPPAPEVTVVQVQPQTLPLQSEMVGRLSAFRTADVRARVPGVLLKRNYTEGSDVREGQTLFQIDPAPLRATLNSAQAQLASAQATYANAHASANRARELIPQKFVSQSDLDNAEALERSSSAAIQQARAAVTSAQINLSYTNVTAPISGRAGKQQVTEGALVGQGDVTLLTTVDQINPLYVNFSVAADQLASLQQSQSNGEVALADEGTSTVQIAFANGSLFNQVGTIDFSSTTVDPATGAVSLRAKLPNPDGILLPGSFVSIKATMGERHNVFLVPQTAVQRDASGFFVMTVDTNNTVKRKNIQTAGQQNSDWLVTDGLQANDKVITAGLQKIQENATVNPVPPASPATANASTPTPTVAAQQAAAEPKQQ